MLLNEKNLSIDYHVVFIKLMVGTSIFVLGANFKLAWPLVEFEDGFW